MLVQLVTPLLPNTARTHTRMHLLMSGVASLAQDRLEHLRQQCGPHVTAVAKDSVEGICSKIYQLSSEYCRRLQHTHLSLLQDPPTGACTHTPPFLTESSVLCIFIFFTFSFIHTNSNLSHIDSVRLTFHMQFYT